MQSIIVCGRLNTSFKSFSVALSAKKPGRIWVANFIGFERTDNAMDRSSSSSVTKGLLLDEVEGVFSPFFSFSLHFPDPLSSFLVLVTNGEDILKPILAVLNECYSHNAQTIPQCSWELKDSHARWVEEDLNLEMKQRLTTSKIRSKIPLKWIIKGFLFFGSWRKLNSRENGDKWSTPLNDRVNQSANQRSCLHPEDNPSICWIGKHRSSEEKTACWRDCEPMWMFKVVESLITCHCQKWWMN